MLKAESVRLRLTRSPRVGINEYICLGIFEVCLFLSFFLKAGLCLHRGCVKPCFRLCRGWDTSSRFVLVASFMPGRKFGRHCRRGRPRSRPPPCASAQPLPPKPRVRHLRRAASARAQALPRASGELSVRPNPLCSESF